MTHYKTLKIDYGLLEDMQTCKLTMALVIREYLMTECITGFEAKLQRGPGIITFISVLLFQTVVQLLLLNISSRAVCNLRVEPPGVKRPAEGSI